MSSPIFLLSCPRSGSTLLRVMLAGHSRLFCPPELNLLAFQTMAQREAQLGGCRMERFRELGMHPGQGLYRALMELLGSFSENGKRIDDLVRSDRAISSVYAILADLAKPRRLLDKSSFYSANLAVLRRAEAIFEQPLYIYLFRHPYTVIESLVRNRFRPEPNRDLFGAGEWLWTRTNSNITEFLSAVEPKRQFLVRFEDLVREPEPILAELCRFLGIPFEPALLCPYEGERMTEGIPPAVAALGDVDFRRRDRIDPQAGSRWQRIRLPVKLTTAVPVALSLRYRLPAETEVMAV